MGNEKIEAGKYYDEMDRQFHVPVDADDNVVDIHFGPEHAMQADYDDPISGTDLEPGAHTEHNIELTQRPKAYKNSDRFKVFGTVAVLGITAAGIYLGTKKVKDVITRPKSHR